MADSETKQGPVDTSAPAASSSTAWERPSHSSGFEEGPKSRGAVAPVADDNSATFIEMSQIHSHRGQDVSAEATDDGDNNIDDDVGSTRIALSDMGLSSRAVSKEGGAESIASAPSSGTESNGSPDDAILLSFKPPPSEFEQGWRKKINTAVNSVAWDIVFLFLTFYALYAVDLNAYYGNSSTDLTIEVLNLFLMLSFSVELVLMLLGVEGYSRTVFFYLDLLAALSLVGDLPGVSDAMYAAAATESEIILAAGRTARATRLLRLIRVIRLIRITRLIRIIDVCRGKKKGLEGQKVVDDVDGEEKEAAGTFAAQLPILTSSKVIIGSLIILLVLPFLETCDEDAGRLAGLQYLQTLVAAQTMDESSCGAGGWSDGNASTLATTVGVTATTAYRSCPQIPSAEFELLFNSSVAQYVLQYPMIYALTLNDRVYIEAPENYIEVNLLRVNEVTHVELGPSDTYFDVLGFANFSADFNDYNSIHAENRLALLLTTFSILLLFVGMAVFVVDANKLSRQINEPLNELSQQMQSVSQMQFDHPELPSSNVYEINVIKKSFAQMKKGLQSFSKFLDHKVVLQMLKLGQEAKLRVTRKEVTVVFINIANFKEISERMDVFEILEVLTHYFEVTASLIVDKDGTLLEFIGDEVMAIWNAPVPQEDHVFRAVTQALAIVKAFHQLALAPKKAKHILGGTKFPELIINIGLHCGDVFVGNLGAPTRLKYGVLGDSVNLSARLSRLNTRYKTSILISEDVAELPRVKECFLLRPIDFVAVKGRSNGTAVYEVVNTNADASPSETAVRTYVVFSLL
eukprot:INCI9234.2.p1 GENE.INCI9234.2~~INCI9234.2.p1  ORF type:complete len:803 (+),score=146.36 INCI9234.2:313-2721(+)